MYRLHRFQLSSLQIISLNSSFFVLIFTFKEEIVSLHPRSVLPKLGACQNQLGNITYFEAQVPPRSIKSEILEVGFWYQLFLKPPGDSIIYIYPSLRTTSLDLFSFSSTSKGVCTFSYSLFTSHAFCFMHSTFQHLQFSQMEQIFPLPAVFSSNYTPCLLLITIKCVQETVCTLAYFSSLILLVI